MAGTFLGVHAVYRPFEPLHASGSVRGGLAWLAVALAWAAAAVLLVGLPVLASRRWRTNPIAAIVIGGHLAAHFALRGMSTLNSCWLDDAAPLSQPTC
jgi:hypothetical protein